MKLRHPMSRAVYEDRGDGSVRVEAVDGSVGIFRTDGVWIGGELKSADPQLTGFVGGPAFAGRLAAAAAGASQPVVEPEPARGPRAPRISYQELLDTDTRPVPPVLRLQSTRSLPAVQVPIERYVSQAFHELEVEKVWQKVWQFACREEEIPEPGDHVRYDIANRSVLLVRGADRAVRAFHNVCLHRGRLLVETAGHSDKIQCPFHGWTWKLDGSLREVPCGWDFPHVERASYSLPALRTGCWGGFVFVNFDPECAPLEAWLGELPSHFERWPLEDRYVEAHVAHVLACNWKVAQEAFMEAYHVIATHPQLLPGIGDANSQYDAWDTFSRAITANMTPSPHLDWQPSEQDQLDALITRSLDTEPMLRVPAGATARQTLAQMSRLQLQASVPSAQDLCDAELADSFYYTLFPNFHPWGAYNRIVYRFRPWQNDAQRSLMEVMYLAPFSGARPAPAKLHWLDLDEPWTNAPELGSLAKVFAQDTFNLAKVQAGLRSASHTHVTLGRYQETKIRHFHALLEKFVTA